MVSWNLFLKTFMYLFDFGTLAENISFGTLAEKNPEVQTKSSPLGCNELLPSSSLLSGQLTLVG